MNSTARKGYGRLPSNGKSCTTRPLHVTKFDSRKDHRGVDLISDVLPFARLWYDTPDHVIGYATHSSRSHDAVIRVYDDAGSHRTKIRNQDRTEVSKSRMYLWLSINQRIANLLRS